MKHNSVSYSFLYLWPHFLSCFAQSLLHLNPEAFPAPNMYAAFWALIPPIVAIVFHHGFLKVLSDPYNVGILIFLIVLGIIVS